MRSESLIERIRCGDDEAVAEWMELGRNALYLWSLRLLSERSLVDALDPDDVFQHVATRLVAMARAGELAETTSPRLWSLARQIHRQRLIDAMRRNDLWPKVQELYHQKLGRRETVEVDFDEFELALAPSVEWARVVGSDSR